jgi:hypothetical protein
MKISKKQRQDLFQNQIVRLARIYIQRPITKENIDWHNRVGNLQCETFKLKKAA